MKKKAKKAGAAETERQEFHGLGTGIGDLFFGVFEIRLKNKGVTAIHRCLKPGSQKERKARATLAHFLRGKTPKTQEFLNELANWVEGRGRGRPKTLHRDQAIASFIQDCRQKGDKVKTAKEKAGNNWGEEEETINRIWKRRKSLWK